MHKCDSIGKYIAQVYRMNGKLASKSFSKFGIGSGQYVFLIHLYSNDGINQECISSNLNIDKGTTARALKRLEELGYIIRVVDEEDKRAYRVFLTDKAKYIEKEFFEILAEANRVLTKDFTEEEKALAISLLKRMVNNSKNHV
ncbi:MULTISPECIES: MarR family winged helix-turn-helix transcriptional regulator [unclassified Clostridium]|uniref:MarR family winged helix-turn-helix transcriptional regulator n=1 Tax=unclassified Clostridium TaxID=2614128 RepID=UPI0025BB05EA|nr:MULTISPECIES: MarR family transcriptional regulator [unclassified Clostridium]